MLRRFIISLWKAALPAVSHEAFPDLSASLSDFRSRGYLTPTHRHFRYSGSFEPPCSKQSMAFRIYYTPPSPQHSFPYAFTFSLPSPSKLCSCSPSVDCFLPHERPRGQRASFWPSE
ncbi:hypothetical protein EDC04DRAFT_950515 [Pisolithus marmoratus]|nr:hypothetical protein EDC04DRAFT_950515 [Pisolithus marmoratus]